MTDQDQKADTAPAEAEAETQARPDEGAVSGADPEPATPVAAGPAPRRGGIGLPLLGGALAAVIGYGVAHFDLLKLRPAYDDAALRAEIAATASRTDALEAQVAAHGESAAEDAARLRSEAEAALAPVLGLPDQVLALTARVDAVDAALVAATTASPGGAVSPAALAALATAVDALKADVAALAQTPANPDAIRAIAQEELAAWEAAASAKLQSEAAEAEATAKRAAALAALQEAAQTGAPYAQALADLGLADVPEAVSRYADTGLPTAASLAADFPDPARAALEASLRAAGGDGLGSRIWTFLRIQTGARSLTPQEGDDPDAVLSRAEAALAAGDVALALTELAALPPDGQTALAAWSALAQDHVSATQALLALTAP